MKKGENKMERINKEWGFWGTNKSNFNLSDDQNKRLFEFACGALKGSKVDPYQFLNSRVGRHLSDSLDKKDLQGSLLKSLPTFVNWFRTLEE